MTAHFYSSPVSWHDMPLRYCPLQPIFRACCAIKTVIFFLIAYAFYIDRLKLLETTSLWLSTPERLPSVSSSCMS